MIRQLVRPPARFLFRSFNPIKFELALLLCLSLFPRSPFGNVAEWPEKEKLQRERGKADGRDVRVGGKCSDGHGKGREGDELGRRQTATNDDEKRKGEK